MMHAISSTGAKDPRTRDCKKFCVQMIFFAEKNHLYTKFLTVSRYETA